MPEPTQPEDARPQPLALLRPRPGESREDFARRVAEALATAGALPPEGSEPEET